MLIVTSFIDACFKYILVSAPWRCWGNNAKIFRRYVIKIVCKHYRVVHLLVFFIILTDYGTITPLIENYILIIKISRSTFKTELLHNFHTYWNFKQPFHSSTESKVFVLHGIPCSFYLYLILCYKWNTSDSSDSIWVT